MQIGQSVTAFQRFCGTDLTATLAGIEASVRGLSADRLRETLATYSASPETLAGAGQLKRLLGQLNVVIHALGILLCLPRILEPGETIEAVSLGAGNTGRLFDLETNRRIAEFKFITWQGGPESIRQNGLFKDFYLLAEHDTIKRKYLYVLETHHPLKFLNGGRALDSVISKNVSLYRQFQSKYGNQYRTVREYYQPRQEFVLIEDVSHLVSGLLLENAESETSA